MENKANNIFSNLPAGWEVKTVEQVFDFYPTASYSRDKMFKDNNPSAIGYIHYGDIHTKYNLILDVPKTEIPYISEELKKDFEYIKDGDLILSDTSEDYDGVGKCIEILNVGNNRIISGLHTLMLRPKGNDLMVGFKGYLFSGEYVRNSLLRIVTGIKVYSIAKAMLAKVDLPIPSIQEQKEITNILLKVDEAITSVEKSIAAAERLKKSLMQNLLTGKMKPDGTFRTPDEFYIDEKFGKVPKGWKVVKFGKRVVLLYGKSQKEVVSNNGSIPIYGTGGVIEYATKALCNHKSVLVGRKGTIDKPFFIDEPFWAVDTTFFVDTFIDGNMKYLYYILLRMNLGSLNEATGVPSVTIRTINSQIIHIPPLNEQNIIVQEIEKVEKQIIKSNNNIATLERLKKSLMQNLLTGKVRVK